MTTNKQSTSTRRKFLGGAAVATVAAVTAPSVVKAQGPISMYVWPGMTLWLPNYLYGN